ncbi:MAG: DUF4400 domain-containing protein [Pseudomonadota bacterium]
MLAASLLLSILIESTGIALGWWGNGHAAEMLAREVQHLQFDQQRDLIGIPAPGKTALRVVEFLQSSGLSQGQWQSRLTARGINEPWRSWLCVPVGVLGVFSLRLVVCLYSAGLMVLCATVGLQEGLMRRELRKWGGGAESAFLYHHLKRWLRPLLITGWLTYLALPISVHPNWIWMPLAVGLGLVLMATASLWKRLT